MTTSFDPSTHQYFISGRPVPSVTQVLREVLPDAARNASDWHMQRGTAVHACAALIARGKQFKSDPAIDGQVTACRKWFDDFKPDVIEVETQMFSAAYNFAGTMDMRCRINGKDAIVDWKSTLSDVAQIQVGGYGVLCPAAKWGLVVALQEDGNYKCGETFKLERRKQEFLACLTVFNIRKRMGLIKSKENAGEN